MFAGSLDACSQLQVRSTGGPQSCLGDRLSRLLLGGLRRATKPCGARRERLFKLY